jgi:diaminopimelate decarboxylase
MTSEEILAIAAGDTLTAPGLRLRGIHVHVGSDLTGVRGFCAAGVRAARLLAALRAARESDGPWIDTIDFGGGFPLPADGAPGPDAFRSALLGALHDAGLELPPRPAIEPGRYLVGAAGWLVARVLHARDGGRGAQQVVLDAGMTEFIRPALYGSRHSAHALPVKTPGEQAGRGGDAAASLLDTDLEGPVCESTDSFGRHALPPLDRGDLVAIEQAGAYGASFTSRYNGRPAPAEVLLWLDGSLQPCERPPITPVAPLPTRAPYSAVRPARPVACHAVGSAPVTKESLP